MATKRVKSGGYHGVQGMAFVPKVGDDYPIDGKIEMKFAKNLKLTPVFEAVEQYADNMLLFRVPRDDGYEGELGKGEMSFESDTKSLSFGEYKYPIRVYGDKVMNAEGTKIYVDERGLDRTPAMKLCRPEDASFAAFGDTVPVPKVAAESTTTP